MEYVRKRAKSLDKQLPTIRYKPKNLVYIMKKIVIPNKQSHPYENMNEDFSPNAHVSYEKLS